MATAGRAIKVLQNGYVAVVEPIGSFWNTFINGMRKEKKYGKDINRG